MRVIYDHELVLFGKGRFIVKIGDTSYACPADTFIVVPPGKWQASWETIQKTGYRYWSHFDWIYQGSHSGTPIMTFHPAKPQVKAFRHAPSFVPRTILHGPIPSPTHAYDLMERLCAIQKGGSEHDRFAGRALLLELLLELLDTRNRTQAAGHQEGDLASRVRELLTQNLDRHSRLRIQDLMEDKLGYSYAHLCRVFHAKYGIPPLKYMNVMCVNRAKLLLRDTDLTVTQIALRLGFRDPLYFSQLFRKLTGFTPSTFRAVE